MKFLVRRKSQAPQSSPKVSSQGTDPASKKMADDWHKQRQEREAMMEHAIASVNDSMPPEVRTADAATQAKYTQAMLMPYQARANDYSIIEMLMGVRVGPVVS